MFGGVSEGGGGAVKDSVSFYSRSDVMYLFMEFYPEYRLITLIRVWQIISIYILVNAFKLMRH